MTQSINDTYLFVQDLINKNQNGYLPPDEFNRLINQCSYARFNELYGKPESYASATFPISKIAYARTQEIAEKLAPFLVQSTLTFTSGLAPIPNNLVHALSVRANGKTVARVEYDRLASYLNSTIDNPTTDFPIYVQGATTYNIYPTTITTATINYLSLPVEAEWAFDVVDGRPVYNQANSTNLQWDVTEINNICMKLLSMFGISVKDGQMVNYAETQKQLGN